MTKRWQVEIQADGVMPLPDDLLDEFGLEEGDEIEWHDRGDGSWEIRRVPDDAPPRSRIEGRNSQSDLTLTVAQIRDIYTATQNIADNTQIDFVVDSSNGIGPVIRARYHAEIDLTDVGNW